MNRRILLCAFAALFVVFWSFFAFSPRKSLAAENDAKADPSATSATDSKQAAKNSSKGTAAASESDAAPPEESFLGWLYRSLGFRYVVVFLLITFNGVALSVMILLGLRHDMICPEKLALEFEQKVNEKQYQQAYDLAKSDPSMLGKILAAGMSKLSNGYEAAVEAMQEVGESQNMRLEQRNSYVALIAQIGPMFGLLGTVDGMVMAFDVIAHSNVTPKPSELAQGIGTALVTTVVGLWIAIPSIAFYHFVRNRLAKQVLETGVVSGNLMRRFASIQPQAKPN